MHPHDKAAIEKAREDLYVKRSYDPPQSGYDAYEKRFEELVDLRLADLRRRLCLADEAMAEQLGKEIDAVKAIAAPLWKNLHNEREDKRLHAQLND